jgi:Uma2 family endonuclease
MDTSLDIPATPDLGLSDDEFVAFLKHRPSEERWQLIDGEAIMMNPPKLRHQWIGRNLAWDLSAHFRQHRPALHALQEIGLMIPGIARFRPRADVAVIDDQVDLDTSWANRFLLIAEIVSDSNTLDEIESKRRRYVQHPDNLYVLVIEQLTADVDVWSSSSGWRRTALDGLDAVLELPDLGFSMPLSRLYAGTPVARKA